METKRGWHKRCCEVGCHLRALTSASVQPAQDILRRFGWAEREDMVLAGFRMSREGEKLEAYIPRDTIAEAKTQRYNATWLLDAQREANQGVGEGAYETEFVNKRLHYSRLEQLRARFEHFAPGNEDGDGPFDTRDHPCLVRRRSPRSNRHSTGTAADCSAGGVRPKTFAGFGSSSNRPCCTNINIRNTLSCHTTPRTSEAQSAHSPRTSVPFGNMVLSGTGTLVSLSTFNEESGNTLRDTPQIMKIHNNINGTPRSQHTVAQILGIRDFVKAKCVHNSPRTGFAYLGAEAAGKRLLSLRDASQTADLAAWSWREAEGDIESATPSTTTDYERLRGGHWVAPPSTAASLRSYTTGGTARRSASSSCQDPPMLSIAKMNLEQLGRLKNPYQRKYVVRLKRVSTEDRRRKDWRDLMWNEDD